MKFGMLSGLLLCVALYAHAGAGGFENETETPTTGWRSVPAKVARPLILREVFAADVAAFNQTAEPRITWGQALVLQPVPVSQSGARVFFVRPRLEPYFAPLYGAHSYVHWLLKDGHPVFKASSDGLKLLDTASHHMRDIEERICMTGQCAHTRLQFDGRAYQPVVCRLKEVDSGKDLGACGTAPQ